jgi:predicted aspartyl protease
MKFRPRFRRRVASILILLVAAAGAWLLPSVARGRISLDALQSDGYGKVPIKRPQPNVLTVLSTVNGRQLSLIVDTGWLRDGITLNSDSMPALHGLTEEVNEFGTAAGGSKLMRFKKTSADKVTLGNVELTQVPLYFGNIKALGGHGFRTIGADGFIGAGFLNTCGGIVDLQNLCLYLRPPGKGHRAVIGPALKATGLSEAPLLPNCLVDVEVNGHSAKMVVDTGAYFAAADMRAAPKLKALGYSSRVMSEDASGTSGETQVIRNLRSFKIGGINVRSPDLRLGTFHFYTKTGGKVVGLLGMDILGSNGTIIDFGQHKLYFYKLE